MQKGYFVVVLKRSRGVLLVDPAVADHTEGITLGGAERAHTGCAENDTSVRQGSEDFLVPDRRYGTEETVNEHNYLRLVEGNRPVDIAGARGAVVVRMGQDRARLGKGQRRSKENRGGGAHSLGTSEIDSEIPNRRRSSKGMPCIPDTTIFVTGIPSSSWRRSTATTKSTGSRSRASRRSRSSSSVLVERSRTSVKLTESGAAAMLRDHSSAARRSRTRAYSEGQRSSRFPLINASRLCTASVSARLTATFGSRWAP